MLRKIIPITLAQALSATLALQAAQAWRVLAIMLAGHWRNPQLPSPHELPEVRAMQREAQR